MDIKADLKAHLKTVDAESVAIDAGVSLEAVAKWAKNPPMDAINWYVGKVLPRKKAPAPAGFAGVDLPHCQWEGRTLSILLPFYKQTNPATTISLMALCLDLGKSKIRADLECGDGIIANARNKLATRFLQTDAEWSLWIDDDIIPPVGRPAMTRYYTNAPKTVPDEVLGRHVVDRLMSHQKKLVGGMYFGRHEGGRATFHEAMKDLGVNTIAASLKEGLRETQWVATGCMLVHRSVYLDIQKAMPELGPCDAHSMQLPILKWKDKDGKQQDAYATGLQPEVVGEFTKDVPARDHWDFFRTEGNDGEDVAFCKRAQKVGHTPHVDQGLVCGHVGYKVYGPWTTSKGLGGGGVFQ